MTNTPRARSLRRLLKAAHEASGLSVRAVADQLGWSSSRVSRIENAKQGITETDVSALLALLGVTGTDREQLLRMVRELDEPMWWELHKDLPEQLSTLIDAEQRASRLTCICPTLVPGLLQTRGYTRAMFGSGDKTPSEVEQAMGVRQTRQGILDKPEPTELIVYLDEPVLMRPVRQPDVRTDQLEHLGKMAARPNVTVQVIPMDADLHFGLNGMFTILEFDNDEPHVFTEASNAGSMITGEEDLAAFYRAVTRVADVALSPEESAQLITRYTDERGNTQT